MTLAIATLGIIATLLAYALSPGVRHAVGHAAHSVKHAVSHVFDHRHQAPTPGQRRPHLAQPIHPVPGKAPKAAVSPARSHSHSPTATAPGP